MGGRPASKTFVREDWVKKLDFTTLEKMSGSVWRLIIPDSAGFTQETINRVAL